MHVTRKWRNHIENSQKKIRHPVSIQNLKSTHLFLKFTVNMPSDAAKKRQAKKKSQAQARGKPKTSNIEKATGTNGTDLVTNAAANEDFVASCTGVLASHPESRDIHVENFSITFHGVELLSDTRLELNCGRRYGLLGLNGCGNIFKLRVAK